MPSWNVTARKTTPITPVTVEADTRELAITQVVATAGEGEQIEVLQCTEALPEEPPVEPPVARSRKSEA